MKNAKKLFLSLIQAVIFSLVLWVVPANASFDATNNLGYSLNKGILDETKGYIYAISANEKKLLFIKTSDLTVEKEISFDYDPSDIDMDNGKLYIALTNYSWFGEFVKKVVVIDISSQNIDKIITTQADSYDITVDGDKLFYTKYNQWSDLRVYDLKTGTEQVVGTSLYQPIIQIDHSNHVLYLGESGISGAKFFSMSTLTYNKLSISNYDNGYGLPYPTRDLILDGSDVFFAGRKFENTNLNHIYGSYSYGIIFSKGNHVFTRDAVYDKNNFNRILQLSDDSVSMVLKDNNGDIYVSTKGLKILFKCKSVNDLKPVVMDLKINGSDKLSTQFSDSSNFYVYARDQYGVNVSNSSVAWAVYDSEYHPTDMLALSSTGYSDYTNLRVKKNAIEGNYILRARSTVNPSVWIDKTINLYRPIATKFSVGGLDDRNASVLGGCSLVYPITIYDQYDFWMQDTMIWEVLDEDHNVISPEYFSWESSSSSFVIKPNDTLKPGKYYLNMRCESNPLLHNEKSFILYTPIPTQGSVYGGSYSLQVPASGYVNANYIYYIHDQYNLNMNTDIDWNVYDSTGLIVPDIDAISLDDFSLQITLSNISRPGNYKIKGTYKGIEYDFLTLNLQLIAQEPKYIGIGGPRNVYVPEDASLSYKFIAIVNDHYGEIMENESVSWSVYKDNQIEAVGLSIDKSGILTVNGSAALGRYFVRARLNSNNLVYQDFSINAFANASLDKEVATFDLNSAKSSEIPITITYNNDYLTAVIDVEKNSYLKSGTDYILSDNNLILFKDFLKTLAVGEHKFTFDFASGRDVDFKLTVVDTTDITPPVVTGVTEGGSYTNSVSISFNEGTATLDDVVFTSGSNVSSQGKHTIIVTDGAGNKTTINFTINAPTNPNLGGGGPSLGGGGAPSVTTTTVQQTPALAALELEETFKDIDNYPWAKDEIEAIAKKGIIKGPKPGYFMPKEKVTRAEFVQMLVSLLELKDEEKINYSDVKAGDWYFKAISSFYKAGIINGYEDCTFKPNKSISRQEMALIIERVLTKYKNFVIPAEVLNHLTFKDSDQIDDYAKKAVAVSTMTKVMNGYSTNLFKPQNFVTRAEASVVIFNIDNYKNSTSSK